MSGSGEVTVVGVGFDGRQEILADMHHGLETGEHSPVATLRREPENKWDSAAVAVILDGTWHIGYIPKNLAAHWAERLDGGQTATVTGVRITRHEKGGNVVYGARVSVEFEAEPEPEPEQASKEAG